MSVESLLVVVLVVLVVLFVLGRVR